MKTRMGLWFLTVFTVTLTLAFAQAVDVTLSLDQPSLEPGQSTILRVFAQVDPSIAAQTDRIFSWYIDVECDHPTAAANDYDSLAMIASDNIPATSSSGTTDGVNRRGIHNTFMTLPGAGKTNVVELAAIPVMATAAGTVNYSVQAGTTATNLSEDFIVAPLGGGNPFTGGDYTAANATLTIWGGVELYIAPVAGAIELTWSPVPGDQYLQFTPAFGQTPLWTTLGGGPHNSGIFTDTVGVTRRTYRLVSFPP